MCTKTTTNKTQQQQQNIHPNITNKNVNKTIKIIAFNCIAIEHYSFSMLHALKSTQNLIKKMKH